MARTMWHRNREAGPGWDYGDPHFVRNIKEDDIITYYPVVTSGKNLPTRVVEWFIVKNGHITGSQDFSTPFSANEQTTKVRGGFNSLLKMGPIGIGYNAEFALPRTRNKIWNANGFGIGVTIGIVADSKSLRPYITFKDLAEDNAFKIASGLEAFYVQSENKYIDIIQGPGRENSYFGFSRGYPAPDKYGNYLIYTIPTPIGVDIGWAKWHIQTLLLH